MTKEELERELDRRLAKVGAAAINEINSLAGELQKLKQKETQPVPPPVPHE